ncbi:hypothetical protein L1887_31980 [Cichorium endivia]|nr:hypothetical protein L1887_31980 [Cichorium endivia]
MAREQIPTLMIQTTETRVHRNSPNSNSRFPPFRLFAILSSTSSATNFPQVNSTTFTRCRRRISLSDGRAPETSGGTLPQSTGPPRTATTT